MPKQSNLPTPSRFERGSTELALASASQGQLLKLFIQHLMENLRRIASNSLISFYNSYTQDEQDDIPYARMRQLLITRLRTTTPGILNELDEWITFVEEDARAEQREIQPELAEDPYVPPPIE